MSRYGRDSEKQAFSYMDDVPVKISEQYKPPRKVALPVSYQHRLSAESVTEEYDFKLEQSVLQKMQEWRKLRQTAVENRTDRIKAQERAALKSQEADPSVSPTPSPYSIVESSSGSYLKPTDASISFPDSPPTVTHPTPSTTLPLTPAVRSISYVNPGSTTTSQYSILTPVPIALSSIDTRSSKVSAHFNLSDFEADTSSPFDNMELKTINEMEELAHVLQPMSIPSHQIKQKPPDLEVALGNYYNSPLTFYNVDQVALCNTFDSKLKKGPVVQPHLNGLTNYSLYATGPRLKDQGTRNDQYVTMVSRPHDYSISGMPFKSESSYSYYPERTWTADMNAGHINTSYSSDPSERTSCIVTSENSAMVGSGTVQQPVMVEGSGYTTLTSTVHHPPLTYGASFPSTCNVNQDQHSPGRSLSKSVPDIVQELEKELKNKRTEECVSSAGRSSHTPPPRPNSFGSTGLENWKPWPDLDSPERLQPGVSKTLPPSVSHHSKKSARKSTLPNPFQDLNPAAQKLVKHISEMGFALPRVARACQLLGEDDKKVVEFLLHVQSLEEKNYPGDLVEKALIVNRYNITHATKYLDAMTQLLDLGFSEESVSDALIKFDNDRDKALDQLIS